MSDESAWPDYKLNEWIREAIRDYSLYFPLLSSTTINCTTGTIEYSLPAGTMGILRVEYQDGESPQVYLARVDRANPIFTEGPFYDLFGEPPTKIVLGESPLTGEAIAIEYLLQHTSPSTDSSTLTMLDAHWMA